MIALLYKISPISKYFSSSLRFPGLERKNRHIPIETIIMIMRIVHVGYSSTISIEFISPCAIQDSQEYLLHTALMILKNEKEVKIVVVSQY